MKPIEEHLANYLLGLQRGPDIGRYFRSCLNLWEEKYGKLVAQRAEKILREGLKDRKGKKA